MSDTDVHFYWLGYNDARQQSPQRVVGWEWSSTYMAGYRAGQHDESCLNDVTNVY